MDKNYIISIQDFLKGRNRDSEFDKADEKRIKLVRHSDVVKPDSIIYKEYSGSVRELYYTNYELFKKWQAQQQNAKMKNVDYIVAFLAEEKCDCRFVGVFKNNGLSYPSGKDSKGNETSVYNLQEVDSFIVLKDRIFIDWGKGTLSWMQSWQKSKEVKRIEQESIKNDIPFFTRYEDVVLSLSELKKVVENKEWKSRLECLNCVYLILDKANGKQYVGVTYKNRNDNNEVRNGILSRWTEYAQNGHGGNKMLEDLLADPPKGQGKKYAEENFQWSILEILPLNVVPKVAIEREKLYKKKLGTREHGYNEN